MTSLELNISLVFFSHLSDIMATSLHSGLVLVLDFPLAQIFDLINWIKSMDGTKRFLMRQMFLNFNMYFSVPENSVLQTCTCT